MLAVNPYQFWFVTGSQHLYGPEAVEEVEQHARQMVAVLNESGELPFELVCQPVLTTPEAIHRLCAQANGDPACAGLITWMHTFSPAKMWISGLAQLNKPLLHLHTQYNRDIPWETIDMDFMNLNQSAHGDREYAFITARMNIARKVVAGYWQDPRVRTRLASWMRTAVAVVEGRQLKVARFGDNMREVAVTEGDKVAAQIQFGWSVSGYGVGDLVERIKAVSAAEVNRLLEEYASLYELGPDGHQEGPVREAIKEQARIELGLRAFLEEGQFQAFTTTFEDLHGLKQLPGLAVQRLMADGYGFGAEGDWKTAALLRCMKLMAANEGTSFMEDYTYHLEPGQELVLGAHMLEVCPTIADERPRIEVHPLAIGGKDDPARLVFTGRSGAAVNAALIDLGHRFRLVVNTVQAVKPRQEMPKLPVARVLWRPQPDFHTATEAWLRAGGAHHTCFSYHVSREQLLDWAEMVGIECVLIDDHTDLGQLYRELKLGEMVWR